MELDIATRACQIRNEARALEWMAKEDKLSTQWRIHSAEATTSSVAVESSPLRSIQASSASEAEEHVSSLTEQPLPRVDSVGGAHITPSLDFLMDLLGTGEAEKSGPHISTGAASHSVESEPEVHISSHSEQPLPRAQLLRLFLEPMSGYNRVPMTVVSPPYSPTSAIRVKRFLGLTPSAVPTLHQALISSWTYSVPVMKGRADRRSRRDYIGLCARIYATRRRWWNPPKNAGRGGWLPARFQRYQAT